MNEPELSYSEKNQLKIIDLLTEIRDELREIKENTKDEETETYTCDWCEEEKSRKPYKKVNKYDFCSAECWEEWESD